MTIKVEKGFIIHGSTGCTCCRDLNFIQGIFETLEDASRAVHDHIRNKTVASQYSRTGRYEIQEIEYERIDEDRIIIESHVFDNNFYENENLYPDGTWHQPIPLDQL